ncbi:MAG: hypothetical protein J6X33_03130 [Clostridiales bacterium]|nr:hypothetical protein [Clostridiales bacterium]
MLQRSVMRMLSAILVSAFLLSSCTTAGGKVTEETEVTGTSGSTEIAKTEETPASESIQSKADFTDEEKAIAEHYNDYANDADDRLVPCDEGDPAALELKAIPGVKLVARKSFFEDKEYLVFFDEPLDHKDPSKGTFTQTVYVYYEGKDAPNCFLIDGYEIGSYVMSDLREDFDTKLPLKIRDDILGEYSIGSDSNFILPEYRLYGTSQPDNLTKDDLEFWGFMNCEQAAEDFHDIIEAFKDSFTGKWCIEGLSKGGEATVYQLAKHPEDGDLFLGMAAMVLMDKGHMGLYKYAYTTAGDLVYGKEKAKNIRDLITEFQIECLKNRDKLTTLIWSRSSSSYRFSPDLDKEILFDCMVLDQVYYWQYLRDDHLDKIKEAMSLKDAATHEDKEMYITRLCDALEAGYSGVQYALPTKTKGLQEIDLYSFLFQCYHEDGHFGYDFSYLRKAIKKSGSKAKLYVTKDMEDDIWDLRIDPSHRDLFSYDPSVLEARKSAIDNPDKPLILINGLTDIFNTCELTESDRSNIFIFNLPKSSHIDSFPGNLDAEQRLKFDEIVKKYMTN